MSIVLAKNNVLNKNFEQTLNILDFIFLLQQSSKKFYLDSFLIIPRPLIRLAVKIPKEILYTDHNFIMSIQNRFFKFGFNNQKSWFHQSTQKFLQDFSTEPGL